jgi:hypothetical protein
MATTTDLADSCLEIIQLVLDDRLLTEIESHYELDRTERLTELIGPAYEDQIQRDLRDAARSLAALYEEQAADNLDVARIGQLLKSKAADCRTYHNAYLRRRYPDRCFAHLQQLDDISRALQQLGTREFGALQEFIWYYWDHLLNWIGHLSYCDECSDRPLEAPLFPPLEGTKILDQAGATSSGNHNPVNPLGDAPSDSDIPDVSAAAPDEVFRVDLAPEDTRPLTAIYKNIPLRRMPGYAAITFHSQTPPIPHLLSMVDRDRIEDAFYTRIPLPDTGFPLGQDFRHSVQPMVLSGRNLRSHLGKLRRRAQGLATHIENHVLPVFDEAAALLVEVECGDDLTHVLFHA